MSNGSVLVVGGERGSNDIAEPTLEVLPKPPGGPTYLFMDWLNRTDPNNLYPFLHMLPSGNIFAGAWVRRSGYGTELTICLIRLLQRGSHPEPRNIRYHQDAPEHARFRR